VSVEPLPNGWLQGWDEPDEPDCEHLHSVEIWDAGTYSMMWCADCESEWEDPN